MNLVKGDNVTIKDDVIIGNNVILDDDVYLDYGVIIRDNVHIKKGTYIGIRCILGEVSKDFFIDKKSRRKSLIIGENSIIRSETIIYEDSIIGDNFETGHRVTIREKSTIGKNVRIGTLSDLQGDCKIGNYVNIHSNVHIAQKSIIKNFVWIYPYTVFTNDPTPPSYKLKGVIVEEYAVIAVNCILLPGINIGKNALVGAGSIVTKDVKEEVVVVGNPAKEKCSIYDITDAEKEESIYPWMRFFSRGMPWDKIGFDKWEEDNND